MTDVCDQSETDEYERFFELWFMEQATVPLSIVSTDSYFKREIP